LMAFFVWRIEREKKFFDELKEEDITDDFEWQNLGYFEACLDYLNNCSDLFDINFFPKQRQKFYIMYKLDEYFENHMAKLDSLEVFFLLKIHFMMGSHFCDNFTSRQEIASILDYNYTIRDLEDNLLLLKAAKIAVKWN
jgi:hypothetical protein